MSFNIRNGIAKDGPNHWRLRKELVLKTIRDFDPDVLGAQEVRGFQAEFSKEHLSDYGYHGTTRVPANKEEEQCAVFYRKSRFDSIAAGHFWLSDTPDVPGSRSWDSAHPRMVSWVQLRERARPDSVFFVFNTHFDHVGQDARLQSAAIIRSRIQKIAGSAPSILVGDFNSAEGSLPYQVLLYSTKALRLTDTYRSQHSTQTPEGESTSTRWKGNRSGKRIDWILSSPHWQISAAAIDYANDAGRYPSDHYPVNAILTLAH
jgi:endonuclease/exonuclease/phosphatase family metal-dependent hydrolase